jgi:hypothetical protein
LGRFRNKAIDTCAVFWWSARMPYCGATSRARKTIRGWRNCLRGESMGLAFLFRGANERYATDYPAAVGNHMTNTDSSVFMNLVPAVVPIL